jgi:hypothetical protein
VLIVAFFAHMCVSTLAREALVRGFDVSVDEAGTGARTVEDDLLGFAGRVIDVACCYAWDDDYLLEREARVLHFAMLARSTSGHVGAVLIHVCLPLRREGDGEPART